MTTHTFTFADAHTYGDVLPAMMRLRFRVFVEREEYEVPSFRGMEYDSFDTPAARYTVCKKEGEVLGCFRLIPPTQAFMMDKLWKYVGWSLLTDEWEVSRFAIDHTLPSALRQQCARELVLALIEEAEAFNIRSYLFLSHKGLIQRMLGPDVQIVQLTGERLIGKGIMQALRVHLNQDVLDAARRHVTR